MRRALLWLCLAGCAAPARHEAAIVMGEREVGFPAVVAVARVVGGRIEGMCTGSLIAPRAVLSAKHCAFEQASPGGPYTAIPLAELRVMVTHNAFDAIEQEVGVAALRTTPGDFTPADYDAGRDAAVLLLDADITGVAPLELARHTPRVGDALTLVGFGSTADAGGGRKFRGEAIVTALFLDLFETAGPAWTCVGDSGGPALDGAGRIAGITSFGLDPDCAAPETYFVEVARQHALVADALGAEPPCTPAAEICNDGDDDCTGVPDEGCSEGGAECLVGGECRSGECVRMGDRAFCTEPPSPVIAPHVGPLAERPGPAGCAVARGAGSPLAWLVAVGLARARSRARGRGPGGSSSRAGPGGARAHRRRGAVAPGP